MRVVWRLILVIYGLLVAACSLSLFITLLLFSTDVISYSTLTENIYSLLGYEYSPHIIAVILFLIFLISIKIMIGFEKDRKIEAQSIVKVREGGQLAISLETFESIVTYTLKKINEVKEFSVYAKRINDDVAISIKISVAPEINVPELASNIQNKVVEAIESATGIKVINVYIKVDNVVSSTSKSRVE